MTKFSTIQGFKILKDIVNVTSQRYVNGILMTLGKLKLFMNTFLLIQSLLNLFTLWIKMMIQDFFYKMYYKNVQKFDD